MIMHRRDAIVDLIKLSLLLYAVKKMSWIYKVRIMCEKEMSRTFVLVLFPS